MFTNRGLGPSDAPGLVEIPVLDALAVVGGLVSPSADVLMRIGSPLNPCRVAMGDVNGDGVPDLR